MSAVRSYEEILKEPLMREGEDRGYRTMPLPEGYELITEGETQAGDAQFCYRHGWEECISPSTPVGGFVAIARKV